MRAVNFDCKEELEKALSKDENANNVDMVMERTLIFILLSYNDYKDTSTVKLLLKDKRFGI